MHKHSRLHSKVPLLVAPSLLPLLGFGGRCLGDREFWALHWMAGEHEHKTVWFKLGAPSFPLTMLTDTKSKLRKVLWRAEPSGGVNQHCVGEQIRGGHWACVTYWTAHAQLAPWLQRWKKSHLGSNYSKNAVLGPILCSGFLLQIPTDTLPRHTDRHSTQTYR